MYNLFQDSGKCFVCLIMERNKAQQCLAVQVSNPFLKEHCSFFEIFQRISTIIDDNRLPLFVTLRGQTNFFLSMLTDYVDLYKLKIT